MEDNNLNYPEAHTAYVSKPGIYTLHEGTDGWLYLRYHTHAPTDREYVVLPYGIRSVTVCEGRVTAVVRKDRVDYNMMIQKHYDPLVIPEKGPCCIGCNKPVWSSSLVHDACECVGNPYAGAPMVSIITSAELKSYLPKAACSCDIVSLMQKGCGCGGT